MSALVSFGLAAALLTPLSGSDDQACVALVGDPLHLEIAAETPSLLHFSTLEIVNSCASDVVARIRLDPAASDGSTATAASLRTTFSAAGAEVLDANWSEAATSSVVLDIPAGTTLDLDLRSHLVDGSGELTPGSYRADFGIDWILSGPSDGTGSQPSDPLAATGISIDIAPTLTVGAAAAAAGILLLTGGRRRARR